MVREGKKESESGRQNQRVNKSEDWEGRNNQGDGQEKAYENKR